jgi:transcriptional regulator with XRE-family HTH domain
MHNPAMISVPQIKAARGFLGWNQKDLADASGVSQRAIAKIELEQGNPRKDTLLFIKLAFEKEGIVFLGLHGIEKRDEKFDIKTFTGKDGLFKVGADIIRTLPKGGEVLLANVDNRFWFKYYRTEVFEFVENQKAHGMVTRCLVEEGETSIMQDPDLYRAVPKELFSQMPYFLYGNKAVFMLIRKQPFRFILIENQTLIDAFRAQFEYNWKIGKKLLPSVKIQRTPPK